MRRSKGGPSRWSTDPDKLTQSKHNWSVGKQRANAKRRREMPSRLVARLRQAVAKVGLTCLGYEYEAGPAEYPFWFDVWVRLPDGREAGIDTIWDSGVAPKPHHLVRLKKRADWMQQQGHPHLYLDKKLSSIEMELALRVWLRKLRSPAADGGASRP